MPFTFRPGIRTQVILLGGEAFFHRTRCVVTWTERVMGVEPMYPGWRPGALPLGHTRMLSPSRIRTSVSRLRARRPTTGPPVVVDRGNGYSRSGRRDLNPQHPRWKRGALPLSYFCMCRSPTVWRDSNPHALASRRFCAGCVCHFHHRVATEGWLLDRS